MLRLHVRLVSEAPLSTRSYRPKVRTPDCRSGDRGSSPLTTATEHQRVAMPLKDPKKRSDYNREYRKGWYAKNKERHKKNVAERTRQYRPVMRKVIQDHLLTHPCVDCGESDPVVLDFDHRNPEEKEFSIGHATRRLVSISRLKREMEKCDVRCANCHRRRTHREGHWFVESSHRPSGDLPRLADNEQVPSSNG